MIEIRADAISCIGSREVNEDSYIMRNDGRGRYMFAVADGLGGHGQGEVASQAAMRAAAACFDRWDEKMSMQGFLAEAMWTAQNEIMRLHQETGETNGMKTTCVILVVSGNRAMWAHVGDSRLYWLINGTQLQRTKDHSVPQMLVQQNDITEDQIRNHPDRNKLLRAMGNEWNKPKFDISEEYVIDETTAFLLCTDGFWELIQEQEMVSIYRAADSPKKWLESMLRVVQVAGVGKDMDNHTAVAVFAKPDPTAKLAAAQQNPITKIVDQIMAQPRQIKVLFAALVAIIVILLVILACVFISGHKDESGRKETAEPPTVSLRVDQTADETTAEPDNHTERQDSDKNQNGGVQTDTDDDPADTDDDPADTDDDQTDTDDDQTDTDDDPADIGGVQTDTDDDPADTDTN